MRLLFIGADAKKIQIINKLQGTTVINSSPQIGQILISFKNLPIQKKPPALGG